jgi:3'-phosphoadenosine 5'-phosphosulfate (PAPS) 3'-phosphatase
MFIKDKFPQALNTLQRVSSLCPFPTEAAVKSHNYEMWVCGSMNKN